jgi:hypothetical protein
MCFAEPHTDHRAQIVADEAVKDKKLLTGKANVSWSRFARSVPGRIRAATCA